VRLRSQRFDPNVPDSDNLCRVFDGTETHRVYPATEFERLYRAISLKTRQTSTAPSVILPVYVSGRTGTGLAFVHRRAPGR